jgi:hypothetical protein
MKSYKNIQGQSMFNNANASSSSSSSNTNPLMELFPTLFKFGLGIGVAAAKLAINEAGSILGLDIQKPGIFGFNKTVPITEQSVEDIIGNLTSLGKKLQDPRVREQIRILIVQLEPIVKEAATRLVNIATETLGLGLKDAVALACEVPPFSVLCGMSKVVASGEDFIANAGKSGEELLEQKKMGESLFDDTKKKINDIQNVKLNPNLKQFGGFNMRGGARQIKKHRASTKAAIKRINSSLNAFYKSNKTKRHRSK